MEYLVKVTGAVLDTECKTYLVKTDSETEAKALAAQQFNDEFSSYGQVTCEDPQRRGTRAVWAIVLMFIAFLLSIPRWAVPNSHELLAIRPDLLSTLYAILLYAVFIIRFKGIKRTVGSFYDILLCVVCILLLASLIQLFLNSSINLGGINGKTLLPIAILFSAFGVKFISLICMGLITILGFLNVNTLNNAMGFWGVVYILLAFVGMLIYFSVEPVINEALTQVKISFTNSMARLSADATQAKSSFSKLITANKKSEKIFENSDTTEKSINLKE